MTTEKIHPNGPSLSRILAGAWRWHNVSSERVEQLIQRSLEQGISSFDHADIYGDHDNEEIFGRALRKNKSLRDKMELVTKCGIKLLSKKRPGTIIKHYDTSAEYLIWSVENSLKNLATDYLDLLLIHRPDPLLNPEEVAAAFVKLKEEGKVKYFGVSNFTTAQFEMLNSCLPFPLVTNQIMISLFNHESLFDGTVDSLMKLKVRPMAWSPLGGGDFDALNKEEVKTGLTELKEKYKATSSQLLLTWLLKHPARIFPIVGTTKPERIEESAQSVSIELDRQDWFRMLKWITGKDVA